MIDLDKIIRRTPGQWIFSRANDGLHAFRIAANTFIIADVLFQRTTEYAPSEGEAKANAHLIAAAPDLLAEVERLRRALHRIRDYPVHSEPVGGAIDMQMFAAKALAEKALE